MTSIKPVYTSHYAQVNGMNLHYYRSTPHTNRPTVVLVHGITDNGMCWVQVAEALREKYDLIMPDQRGHGFSDKPAEGYTIEILAADIAGLIDILSLDKPAILGQSMGGMVVIATAALFPDKVRCVIIEEPGLFPHEPTPEERVTGIQNLRDELSFYQSLSRAELIAHIHQEQPLWHENILGPWADAKHQLSIDALLKIGNEVRWASWREYIPLIRCPILLLASDPTRGALVTPEIQHEVESLWQNGRSVRFQGAGHTLHQELFGPCLQAVNEFLDEIYTKPR